MSFRQRLKYECVSAQGAVSGCDLWNILFNKSLKSDLYPITARSPSVHTEKTTLHKITLLIVI